MDIALIVESTQGVVDVRCYERLKELRTELCEATGQDIDLVPHTQDEIADTRSPLWWPKHNLSLVHGIDLVGRLPIAFIAQNPGTFSHADLSAFVLHDNRTICRRQIVRSLKPEEARIFASKLLHGPANALMAWACENASSFPCHPSSFRECVKSFDGAFDVSTGPAIPFLETCTRNLGISNARLLLRWYENLMNVALKGPSFRAAYQFASDSLAP